MIVKRFRPNDKTWEVQVGQGRGSYQLRYSLVSEQQAIRWFNGLNTHSGHKKRLVAPDGTVLARVIT